MAPLLPWLAGAPLDAPLAWRQGQPISRRQYLEQVRALAVSLAEAGPLLAITDDRYRFALALGAATLRGRTSLLPPNHTPDMLSRLQQLFPTASALVDSGETAEGMPGDQFPPLEDLAGAGDTPINVPADAVVAHSFTSGSTGLPQQHEKRWGLLHTNIEAEASRMAEFLGRTDLQGVVFAGTVPAHHMYGFESTVLIALLGGASFTAERLFFPADIVATLERLPRPRVLVTTPFHLKALIESGLSLPPVDLVVSATAPLSPQLAARAEAALRGPLMEIYGCTECGQVATRRTTEGPEWLCYRGVTLAGNGDAVVASGGHVPVPTPLADVLEVVTPTRFRLLGRSNDLINVAGKRSSLSHLNYHLNSIEGVEDGAFWLPPSPSIEGVERLVAFVVAPKLTREQLLERLRPRIDAVFLPRRVVHVAVLPRDDTGKLPSARLAALAERNAGAA